jgi:hypothetical protein
MFPKMIPVKGVPIPVDSWEELDELIQRYGGDVSLAGIDNSGEGTIRTRRTNSNLPTDDRAILQKFVERESKGLLNKELGAFLMAERKSIRPALRKWGVKVGLAPSEQAKVFDPFNRPDGRGYRLSDAFIHIAKAILQE